MTSDRRRCLMMTGFSFFSVVFFRIFRSSPLVKFRSTPHYSFLCNSKSAFRPSFVPLPLPASVLISFHSPTVRLLIKSRQQKVARSLAFGEFEESRDSGRELISFRDEDGKRNQ